MGNRFSTMERYHYLIRAHAIVAVIAFLVLLPASMMLARFRNSRKGGSGVRHHIYINILVLGLSTIAFILGFMAVGPSRGLTNPHHGIGVAIYVLVIWQTLFGNWVRRKWKKGKYDRRPTVSLMLHQWTGRITGLLGVTQVPLGLALYGSPKWTFVLYTLWMAFLIIVYFVNEHKRYKRQYDEGHYRGRHDEEAIIEEKEKKSGGMLGGILGPLAAGAGAIFLAKKLKGRDHSPDHDDTEVLSSRDSRRDSYSSIHEAKKKSGGLMSKLLAGAAIGAAGIFATKFINKKKDRDEEYSVVGQETPHRRDSRRGPQPAYSEYTESTIEDVRPDRRPGQNLLPAAAGAAAAERSGDRYDRPTTPRPVKRPGFSHRRDSYDSFTTVSPSQRVEKSNAGRNALLGTLGLGWLGKKFQGNRDEKERRRLDEIRRREDEGRRHNLRPDPRYTGDDRRRPARRHSFDSMTESDLTSDYTSVHPGRTATTMTGTTAPAMPPTVTGGPPVSGPPPASYQEALDESLLSRRRSSRERRDAEAAAATAAAALAAAEREEYRRKSRERDSSRYGSGRERSPTRVNVRMGDQNVTVQRMTREQIVERERDERRRRRAGSLSDSEVTSGRYRRDSRMRDESASGAAAERLGRRRRERSEERRMTDAERKERAHMAGVPLSELSDLSDLSPPRPAFAGAAARSRRRSQSRPNKDSAYYSGAPPVTPGPTIAGVGLMSGESLGPPESRGTWSAASRPSGQMSPEEAEERRRARAERRRQERAKGQGSVGFA